MRGIVHIEDEVYITDRNNQARTPVDRVTLAPTWDIDRSGSKGQVSVTADAGVLESGMWLSTYRTITPEQGEIIRYPRGHWHLSRPGIAYPGGHEMDSGSVAVMQTASGSDIVDDIAGVALTEAFYTPKQGHILTDVANLIRMATCGIMGPNLLTNGSFEDGGSSWGGEWGGGGSGQSVQTGPAAGWGFIYEVPQGNVYWRATFLGVMPTGAYVQRWQDVDIPAGTQFMYASGLTVARNNLVGFRSIFAIEFLDSTNTVIGGLTPMDAAAAPFWRRYMLFAEVPAEAVRARVLVGARYFKPGTLSDDAFAWDDIRLGTCTMMPIPDDRINLPQNNAVATTRIQTDEGKNIAYDAINADRLNAISFNAIATDMEGRLTTQASRTLENATARYTFGPDDIELLYMVTPEISAINELPFNHWHAQKEDFQDAANSIAADSYNNNPNDPFSVANSGSVRSAPVITVQDAVDQSALQAIADAARDRYSLSETVRFAIMPMTDIDVYDVVEIADPEMPAINGTWALNSIDASGDYLVITATRAVSREV